MFLRKRRRFIALAIWEKEGGRQSSTTCASIATHKQVRFVLLTHSCRVVVLLFSLAVGVPAAWLRKRPTYNAAALPAGGHRSHPETADAKVQRGFVSCLFPPHRHDLKRVVALLQPTHSGLSLT